MNRTAEQINNAFSNLSPEISEAMFQVDINAKISEIGNKYNLGTEIVRDLDLYATFTVIGLMTNEEFTQTISKESAVPKETCQKIISDINQNIFEEIKKMVEKNKKRAEFLNQEDGEIFDSHFITMPDEVQTAIAQSGWKKNLYEIAKKYKLPIEQMGILEELTIKVISDEILPNKYEEELTSKITLPKEDISNLVGDVNENILKKIRELMKKEEEIELLKKEELAEEIPIPPYEKVINNYELEIKGDEDEIPKPITLEQTGEKDRVKEAVIDYGPEIKQVEKIEKSNTVIFPQPEEKIMEIPIISKEEILPFKVSAEMPKEVEIPRPTQTIPDIFNVPKNIIEEKLKGSTTSDHSVSDYSTPKINTLSTTPHDPYREAF